MVCWHNKTKLGEKAQKLQKYQQKYLKETILLLEQNQPAHLLWRLDGQWVWTEPIRGYILRTIPGGTNQTHPLVSEFSGRLLRHQRLPLDNWWQKSQQNTYIVKNHRRNVEQW